MMVCVRPMCVNTIDCDSEQCVLSQDLQERQEKEVERLNRKLKWYAENQELLDRDKASLLHKEGDIKRLKLKLEQVQSEVRVCVCR